MKSQLSLQNIKPKNIYPLGNEFKGKNSLGEEISFTNFYMQKNGTPFSE